MPLPSRAGIGAHRTLKYWKAAATAPITSTSGNDCQPAPDVIAGSTNHATQTPAEGPKGARLKGSVAHAKLLHLSTGASSTRTVSLYRQPARMTKRPSPTQPKDRSFASTTDPTRGARFGMPSPAHSQGYHHSIYAECGDPFES